MGTEVWKKIGEPDKYQSVDETNGILRVTYDNLKHDVLLECFWEEGNGKYLQSARFRNGKRTNYDKRRLDDPFLIHDPYLTDVIKDNIYLHKKDDLKKLPHHIKIHIGYYWGINPPKTDYKNLI